MTEQQVTITEKEISGKKVPNIKERAQEQIIEMRKAWGKLLKRILIFETLTTFGLVVLTGIFPAFKENIGDLLLETYIAKFAVEIIAMPYVVVRFLFTKDDEGKGV